MRSELERMRDVLRHRGPDAAGLWIADDHSIALGHRRLSVIDLSGGAQPMAAQGGRIQLVYNGEIYNFPELRAQLEQHGRTFATCSDTEVLLAAWQVWGPACVERLNGIYAFAIADLDAGLLFAARDPFGVKPLCYGWWDDRLYIASEAGAIIEDARVPRAVDPVALDVFLHEGCVPAPFAIWRGMRKLPAGCTIRFPMAPHWTGLPEPERWTRPPFPAEAPHDLDEPALLDALDDVLRGAVRRQMVSDVPLGAFLSGGIDSSLVVSYLAEAAAEPVRTWSVSFDGDPNDEAPWAHAVAQRYGTVHERIVMDRMRLQDLADLAPSWDEPFADPAALPLAALSVAARREVTVALSGDGGDETHAGYPRYTRLRSQQWIDRVPLAWRAPASRALSRLRPSFKRRGALEQLGRAAADRFDAMTWEIPPAHRRALYSEEMLTALRAAGEPVTGGMRAWRRDVFDALPLDTDMLDRLQHFELATLLPERLMTKVDRASMRVGLECRVPLLDPEAVAFAGRIPPRLRARDGRPKYVLRQLLARRMGADFVARRKQGFTVPVRRWLQEEPDARLLDGLLPSGIERWLDPARVRRVIVEHPRGRDLAWPLLAFAHWVRAFRPTA